MRRIYYFFALVLLLGAASCQDFLEEYSQKYVYAKTIEDFDELLAGDGYMYTAELNQAEGTSAYPYWLHVMDDDVKQNSWDDDGNCPFVGFYTWESIPFGSSSSGVYTESKDEVWGKFYKSINTLNVVLAEVEKFKDEDPDGCTRIKGESYFLRAGYYFGLVNIYAKPYAPASADADMGVPLKLTSVVVDEPYVRSSLKDTYECIVSDLQTAIRYLNGVEQPSVYRANETAARVLLSRVYLYMQEWDLAMKQCDTIMQDRSYSLLDYNRLSDESSLVYASSPEMIFSQGEYRHSYMQLYYRSNMSVSDQLLDAMDASGQDLRRAYGFGTKSADYYPTKLKKWSDGGVSDCFVLRLSEVYLNKAEAAAMKGDGQTANDLVWELRGKRLKSGTMNREEKSGQALIDFIRQERRFELCFEGHRWFDLRRYAVNEKYPKETTINHVYRYRNISTSEKFGGGYVLNPYPKDAGWVIPLPAEEIIYNEGSLVNNEERPERNFEQL